MTTFSEDVLLQVPNVRYRKGDGTLYVMSERIAWMAENKDTVTASHRYADVKLQKISPEGKAKIQLQLVLHDGSASTFHFTNPMGATAQAKDRDDVKELLQQMLPKFKRKVDKELEEKNSLLSKNPSLLQLYKDLVITQIISPDEFWSQHAGQYIQKDQDQGQQQEVGVSGAFLAEIKPQTDGCNGLKYNLTADIMESIFKTYPVVKKKHQDYVPHKMSEEDFWKKFFQSHYFHRDRIHAGNKDLFTECAKHDDQEIRKDIATGVEDPLVDLYSFEDKSLGEGYGNEAITPSTSSSTNIVHQNMIRRFNQHSFMVLKACESQKSSSGTPEMLAATAGAASQGLTNGNVAASQSSSNGDSSLSSNDVILPTKNKKARIQEKIEYDDLEDKSKSTASSLSLAKVECYFAGPTPQTSSEYVSGDELITVVSGLKREISMWTPDQSGGLEASLALSVLGELSPGGLLMKGSQQDSSSQLISDGIQQELKQLYSSLCELLRHFWACFPPTTQSLEEKAIRLHETLCRFHQVKLSPFEARLQRDYTSGSRLTNHLNQLLTATYRKFQMWQQRKVQGR